MPFADLDAGLSGIEIDCMQQWPEPGVVRGQYNEGDMMKFAKGLALAGILYGASMGLSSAQ